MSEHSETVRHFTLLEARAELLNVRPLVSELVESKRRLDAISGALSSLTPAMRQNGHRTESLALTDQIERLIEHLSSVMHELEKIGVIIKDVDSGLIDFPSLFQGRTILLCWRLGEQTITHWHEVDAGFAGRKPVQLLDE